MKTTNFNDHLDDMMQRLMNEDITAEEMDLEIKRSKAVCQVAAIKIEHNKTALRALELVTAGDIDQKYIPKSIIATDQFQLTEKSE